MLNSRDGIVEHSAAAALSDRSDAIWNAMISFAIIVLAPLVFWTWALSTLAGSFGHSLSSGMVAVIAAAMGFFLTIVWAVLFIGGRDGDR